MQKQSVVSESYSAVLDVGYYSQIKSLERQCLGLLTNTIMGMTSMLKRDLVTKSAAITPGLQRGIHVTKIAGLGNINNHQAIHVLPRNRFSAGNSLLSPLHPLTFPSRQLSISLRKTSSRVQIDVSPMIPARPILPAPSEDGSNGHIPKRRKKSTERVRVTRACDGCKK